MSQLNNNALVQYLILTDRLYSKNVIDAFFSIDRADFVVGSLKMDAYYDMPLSIGYYQTISQPQVVAFMLELLDVEDGDEVLDLGSGSGYTTALLSKLVGKDGFVYALERVSELIEFSKKNIEKYNLKNLEIYKASNDLGLKDKSFDKILVSAAAKELPQELIDQLKIGGKMVIPINNSIFLIQREENSILKKEFKGFTFVPLVYW